MVAAFGAASSPSLAQDFQWTGAAGDGLWSTKDNWEVDGETPEGAPGCNGFAEGAVVTIDKGGGSISAFCSGIRIDRITAEQTVEIDDAFEFNGVSSVRDAVLTMFNGDLIAGAQLDLSGSTVWEASGISGPGPIVNNDVLMIVGAQQTLRTRLVNLGEVTQSGGLSYDITSPFDLRIVNQGTWELTSTGIGNFGHTRDEFDNEAGATVKKTGSVFTARFLARLNNNGGTILVEENLLSIAEGGAHTGTGTYSVTNDAILQFLGGPTIEDVRTIQLSGNYTAEGQGDVFIAGNFHIAPGGRLTANLSDDSPNGFTVDIGSGSQSLFLDGPLVNEGKMTWKQGSIAGPAGLLNGRAGTLTMEPPFGQTLDPNTCLVNLGTMEHLSNLTLEDFALVDILPGGEYRLIAGDIRSNGGEVLNSGKILKPNVVGVGDSIIRATLELADGGVLQTDFKNITLTGGGFATGSGNRIVVNNKLQTLILLQGGLFIVSGGDRALSLEGVGLIQCNTELIIDPGSTVTARTVVVMGPGGVVRGGGTLKNESGGLGMTWVGASIGPDTTVVNNRGAGMGNSDPLIIDQGSLKNFGNYTINARITMILDGKFVNRGDFELFGQPTGLRTMTVAGNFSNEKRVAIIGPNAKLVFTGPVDQLQVDSGPPLSGKLTGGEWVADPGSWIEFDLVPLTVIDIGASWTTGSPSEGSLALDTVRGFLTVNGDVTVPGNLENTGKIKVEESSSLTVNGDLNNKPDPIPIDNIDSFTEDFSVLARSTRTDFSLGFSSASNAGPVGGYIANNFNNSGIVLPGGRRASGPFRLTGNFNQFPDGVLEIELGGTIPLFEHDQLTVRGNVNLAGTVKIIPLAGFLPQVGQSFDIITAVDGTISGQFDEVVGPGRYDVTYSANVVTATVREIPGDVNLDGALDLTDYGEWEPCMSGPNGGVGVNCDVFDFEVDDDIDLRDWSAFQIVFTD